MDTQKLAELKRKRLQLQEEIRLKALRDRIAPLIFCYEGGDPELEVPVEAFLSNPQVFFSKPETWVLSGDKS